MIHADFPPGSRKVKQIILSILSWFILNKIQSTCKRFAHFEIIFLAKYNYLNFFKNQNFDSEE